MNTIRKIEKISIKKAVDCKGWEDRGHCPEIIIKKFLNIVNKQTFAL